MRTIFVRIAAVVAFSALAAAVIAPTFAQVAAGGQFQAQQWQTQQWQGQQWQGQQWQQQQWGNNNAPTPCPYVSTVTGLCAATPSPAPASTAGTATNAAGATPAAGTTNATGTTGSGTTTQGGGYGPPKR